MVGPNGLYPEWLPRVGVENIIPDGEQGRIDVTGEYPQQLPDLACQSIVVKAHPSNSGIVNAGIYLRLTPDNGFALDPGDSLAFRTNNVSNVGVCWDAPVPQGTGVVCWFAETVD